jgi:UDP-glucose 4-epimerase
MTHVLITGAAGFLGSAVVNCLLADGWKVTALVRSQQRRELPGLTTASFDLAQSSLAGLPTDVSAVVHCAATVPARFNDLEDAETLLRTNSLGTLRLLDWAKKNGIPRFVNCSSFSIYQRPAPLPIPESHPAYPSGHATFYAVSKLAAETYASSMNSAEFRVCSLRFSSLYGPGMKASGVLPSFIALASRGEAITVAANPASLFDFLYVDDAARAITACLTESPVHTVYNIGAGCGVTLPVLAKTCWAIFGPPATPLIHLDAPSTSPSHSVLDIKRAQQDLGYSPAFDLSAGLQQMKAHTDQMDREAQLQNYRQF